MPYTRTYRRRYAPRRASEQEIRAWAAERPENLAAYEHLTALNLAGRLNSFTFDIHRKLHQYGNLSERQVAAVLRGAERDAEYAARRRAEAIELKDAPVLVAGRRPIVGEVLSLRWKHNPYGGAFKMLVREATGNKLYGTVPAALVSTDDENALQQALVGTTVHLTGTVKVSDDDQHFGFFSRPQALTSAAVAVTEVLPPSYTPEPAERPHIYVHGVGRIEQADCGHFPHPGDNGFCETCAEAAAEFGEDL